ncbi:MAG: PilT/PilU family type 4a pilus ATPase [Gammaproteobacteria bacterium]|jgi:twitching motility protein PilU|nr:PilT/PilU family type 4a pilus ATPase [Xanthomonadales bacterium]
MDLTHFLKIMKEKNGSDMFLSTGAPINIKVEGELQPLGSTPLPNGLVKKIAYSIMSEGQVPEFEKTLEMNLAISLPSVGRFRVNVFKQRNEVGMVIRTIKTEIPTAKELKIPELLNELILEKRGLILVAGGTGSGKSTTMASMINHRNENMTGHILTVEDPIEFMHKHKKSIVNQREIGSDTHGYAPALKNALREAPDVILIGEIRDMDTMEAAISFAETGHLCLATIHANNSDQAIERVLNFFPTDSHKNILLNLALNIKAIVAQRLVKDKQGYRLPAVEILINTPMIREMIRRGEVNKLKEAMENSLDDGMQTFDSCLYDLYKNDVITLQEALQNADSSQGLEVKISLSQGGEDDPALGGEIQSSGDSFF